MTNEQILESFYNEYFRSPRKWEFEACGGNLKRIVRDYGTYKNFLEELGYPVVIKGETYEVINKNTGKVEFTGTISDIADEYDINRSSVKMAYHNPYTKYDSLFKGKYFVRMKKFERKGGETND